RSLSAGARHQSLEKFEMDPRWLPVLAHGDSVVAPEFRGVVRQRLEAGLSIFGNVVLREERQPVARTEEGQVHTHRCALDANLGLRFVSLKERLERMAPRRSERRHDPVVARQMRNPDSLHAPQRMTAARNDRISIREEMPLLDV